MKIAVIGLGNIAQKAYLPAITSMEGIELILCSRNTEKLQQVANKYRIKEFVNSVDELIKLDIDAAFVHTATSSHVEIAEKLLLNGINVYIDKPLSDDYVSARRIGEAASKSGKLLMTGFNRRFAPMYKKLKENGKPDIITMQKNRRHDPKQARELIYDDFIHVVDTLRFLMDCHVTNMEVSKELRDGKLYNIVLKLSGANCTAIGIMNRDSGMGEETVEYMTEDKKIIVKDMVNTISYINNVEYVEKYNDWDNTLYKRGFQPIIEHFINCVKNNSKPDQTIEDSLITHQLCEKIVTSI
ncbi:Gfo/Idh/MocA family protein [Candidatus Clostridium radicumherbarum]|uniref:Gfo/Idh/MocA family protein n=1 Tax=Candidatus Clostridium radicumherbarum TaxID=3381662 RepID=A0ABW8TNF9_9CLOT